MDKSIEEYNLYLIKKYDNILNIIEYFSKIHRTFFSEVDISFMNYFLDLSNPTRFNNFCIYEKDLRKYGLINERVRPRDLITKYNLVRNIDWNYQEAHEDETHYSFFNLSGNKKSIVFTPKAFKKLILKSSNIMFMEYYMLIETIFRYYHDYQVKFIEKDKTRRQKELEELQEEFDKKYDKRVEMYEEYIKTITMNINQTLASCRDEIYSILSICNEN